MHLKYRNVNHAFQDLTSKIHSGEILTHVMPSRAGEVSMIEEPVIVTYLKPTERVLFNVARDANPFFHLFESLWMLAGRNDVAPLAYYNGNISDIASDDGKTFNGAYGYRWRRMPGRIKPRSKFGIDQLQIIVDHLKKNPLSRRAVLQMWSVSNDLIKVDTTKDVCCNTHAYFAIETGDCPECAGYGGHWNGVGERKNDWECIKCKGEPHDVPRYLNITVCNRSNDLVWGMLGANVVHFSILQEYMAACLDLDVGSYHQITNNLHVYTERWQPDEYLSCPDSSTWYDRSNMHVSLVQDPVTFLAECERFVDQPYQSWVEPFLELVAKPMCSVFSEHKHRRYDGIERQLEKIVADDWRHACTVWINKRAMKYQAKIGVSNDPNPLS